MPRHPEQILHPVPMLGEQRNAGSEGDLRHHHSRDRGADRLPRPNLLRDQPIQHEEAREGVR